MIALGDCIKGRFAQAVFPRVESAGIDWDQFGWVSCMEQGHMRKTCPEQVEEAP